MDQPAPWCPYPHRGEGPWECCRIKAEDLPSNRDMQVQQFEIEPLPGWTAQQGNAHAEPMIVCAFCDGQYRLGEIHLHTREVHGYELVITPEDRKPHRYQPET